MWLMMTTLASLEWWSFELLILLSGLLPNPQLETSVLSIWCWIFLVIVSFQLCSSELSGSSNSVLLSPESASAPYRRSMPCPTGLAPP